MNRSSVFALLLAGSTAAVLSCTTSRLVTASGETKLGNELSVQVEESMGLVTDTDAATYVEAIGTRLIESSASVRNNVEYTFHVIDIAAPNAFALPGGHIYVSRGLLALMQTEDELANVLAHEIAHVSARHHLRHAVRDVPFVPLRIATGLGSLATGIVSPLLGKAVLALGDVPSALVLATYNRGQESQADELGQGFAAAAGWDPMAMSQVMTTLARDQNQRGSDPSRLNYFDTHPTSPERAKNTAVRASTLSVTPQEPFSPDRRAFLGHLEGLLVGEPASEGVIAGHEYLHPKLDFTLAFPEGWKVSQDDHSVRAVRPEMDAIVLVTIAGKGDAEAIANEILEGTALETESGPTRRGSLDSTRIYATARYDNEGKSYRYALAWIPHGEHVYQISAGAYVHTWEQRQKELEAIAPSFRALTEADAPKIREGRLRIVAADGRTLADSLPQDGAWSYEQALVANGLDDDSDPLDAWFKVAPLEQTP